MELKWEKGRKKEKKRERRKERERERERRERERKKRRERDCCSGPTAEKKREAEKIYIESVFVRERKREWVKASSEYSNASISVSTFWWKSFEKWEEGRNRTSQDYDEILKRIEREKKSAREREKWEWDKWKRDRWERERREKERLVRLLWTHCTDSKDSTDKEIR
jgi:hypothetical protein